MRKRPTLLEKALQHIDAKIAALTMARAEIVAEIEATKTHKAAGGPTAATE